jgi:glycine hydroxymethyltransferase
MLVDLRPFGITGRDFERRLDEVRITVNKNAIPNDPQSPFITSGIRIGTPAVTTRGMREAEMDVLGELICLAATDFEGSRKSIINTVDELTSAFPLYQ